MFLIIRVGKTCNAQVITVYRGLLSQLSIKISPRLNIALVLSKNILEKCLKTTLKTCYIVFK